MFYILAYVAGVISGIVLIGLLKSNGRYEDFEGTQDERESVGILEHPTRVIGLDPRWERINQAFKETEIAE